MEALAQGFTHSSPAVLETGGDPVAIGSSHITALIGIARSAPAGRARLLLHANRDDALHEMVIALPPESCDHPHINFRSGKTFVALSGQFALVHCSEDGADINPIILSAGPWPGERLVHLRAPAWHTIVPLAGDTVFLETIVGPFRGNSFAAWFPSEDQPAERARFADRFRQLARARAAAL
jgi:cupin fold WbuC family metalloprotein